MLPNNHPPRAVNIKSNYPPVPQRRFSVAVLVLLTLLLTAIGTAGYFYYQYRNAQSGVAETKETKALVETISDFMLLPDGEEPTLATVTDREKLAEQPFFQKAENGDKVLIYSSSGRAILYRPSTKKIVDVTSVNVAQPAVPTPETPPAAPAPKIARVALLNGTTVADTAASAEVKVKAAAPNVVVVTKANAVKRDYPGTVVVDVTGQNAEIANTLATALGGLVAVLPVGETAPPDTDVLVILGSGT